MMKRLNNMILGAALIVNLIGDSPALASEISGQNVHVIDGDTLSINYQKVRLWGLHVPEVHKALGQKAKLWLARELKGKHVTCQLSEQVSYDRNIGMCFIGQSDIAIKIIQAGFGRDCTRYSRGLYRAFENAKSKKITLPRYCF